MTRMYTNIDGKRPAAKRMTQSIAGDNNGGELRTEILICILDPQMTRYQLGNMSLCTYVLMVSIYLELCGVGRYSCTFVPFVVPDYFPTTFTCTRRLRGPSNSQNIIPCQVPNTRRPPSTRICSEQPTRLDLIWESLLPSICRNRES